MIVISHCERQTSTQIDGQCHGSIRLTSLWTGEMLCSRNHCHHAAAEMTSAPKRTRRSAVNVCHLFFSPCNVFLNKAAAEGTKGTMRGEERERTYCIIERESTLTSELHFRRVEREKARNNCISNVYLTLALSCHSQLRATAQIGMYTFTGSLITDRLSVHIAGLDAKVA